MTDAQYLTFQDTFPLGAGNMISTVKLINPYDPPGRHRTVMARAMWDTGASVCAISRDLCNRLGLRPYRKEYVRTFATPEGIERPVDLVMINLTGGPYIIQTVAHVSEVSPEEYDFIIGKVIIASGDFRLKVEGDSIHMRLDIDPKFRYLKKVNDLYGELRSDRK